MKVKMITRAAGADGMMDPGQIYDVPNTFGRALVNGGYATLVAEPKKVTPKKRVPQKKDAAETAALEGAPETTTESKPRTRGRPAKRKQP